MCFGGSSEKYKVVSMSSQVAQWLKNPSTMQETQEMQVRSLGSIISWEWSVRGDVKGIEWMGTWEGRVTQGPWKPCQSSHGELT